MKCPKCSKEGSRSTVRSDGATRTLLGGGGSSWDEDGNLHHHDPNKVTRYYHCSNNHGWTTKGYDPCPNEKCDVGKEPPTIGYFELPEHMRRKSPLTESPTSV